MDAAAKAAAAAYPTYRNLSAEKRARFLDAIADEIDGLGDEFVATVCRETALPAGRIQGERGRTSGQLRLFAKVLRRGDFYGARIDRALPDRQPLPRPDLRQYRIALGPVAVFGASNFPLAFSTAGGDTASALAAGCPVVFKAHSGHMATAQWVADAIIRAAEKTDMPAGVFNMIYGGGVGEWLVKHPAIQAVGFTGSLKGGNALSHMAANRPQPIPVFAEMSSINPVFLLPQALEVRGEQIAAQLAGSVTLGCGQFCTNPGLVIGVRSPQFSAFLEVFLRPHEPAAGANHAQCRHAGQLQPGPWRIARTSGPEPSGGPAATGQSGAAAGVQGRCQPVAQGRSITAGGSVRAHHHRHRGRGSGAVGGSIAGLARAIDRDLDWRGRRTAGVPLAGGTVAREGRTDPAQRLSDRGRSLRVHGAWRAVSGDIRLAGHFGRHPGDRSLPAAGVLPELSGCAAARGVAERQSAGDSAAGGWGGE
ncbi:aldehyde dehydrogenase family protein [Pseudomonas sp. UW4]|nr:aldehyde dehydrogenase family protein [Pseudomonas sp. UW4]